MISHSAIQSPIFRLIETYVFDVAFGDDGYPLRVELFQSVADDRWFRCQFWQTETAEVGVYISDGDCFTKDSATHHILVDWAAYLSRDYSNFEANSTEDAVNTVLQDIRNYLAHTSDSEQ